MFKIKMKSTLIQTCNLIKTLNENNYDSHYEGCGNGEVKVVVEQLQLIKLSGGNKQWKK